VEYPWSHSRNVSNRVRIFNSGPGGSKRGDAANLKKDLLQDFIDAVTDGDITLNIDKVFRLDQIVEAHTYMESNSAKGKLVVEL